MELKEVKPAMAKRLPVEYQGVEYKCITACILRIDHKLKDWIYSLELMDKSGHSITVANIKNVNPKENQRV